MDSPSSYSDICSVLREPWSDSPTNPQDSTICFIQLNSVYNEIKNKLKIRVLLPHVKLSLPQGNPGFPLPLLQFQPSCEQILDAAENFFSNHTVIFDIRYFIL